MKLNRVFISSVVKGYKNRRKTAQQALLEVDITPIMAENLEAKAGDPRDIILNECIPECDAMIGIYGNRYGWTGTKGGLSPTEEEYNKARESNKPIYAFIDKMQKGSPESEQQQFLQKVQNWDYGVTVKEFKSLKYLKNEIKKAVTGLDLSPCYRDYLKRLRSRANKNYFEVFGSPVFDIVLETKPDKYNPIMPSSLLATIDGDQYNHQEITNIANSWHDNILRPELHIGYIAIIVEKNRFDLRPEDLKRKKKLARSGFTEYLVNLTSQEVNSRPESLFSKSWLPDPIKKLLESAFKQC